ncbi:3-hydroxyisobutyryl-CoA hydrolase, mitochondrial [Halyomorpha halys]|uniref:3-hydroxyisobutyryl-CoA hydrolase, mitochondrial n=1 Tax=Halyomorpha halys TaxID=286706 RepID=UPI0006D50436|nr:3-hydroxyisobutyryl-CoA hydrolase, mitochondrial-like [Halyomorpha halys]
MILLRRTNLKTFPSILSMIRKMSDTSPTEDILFHIENKCGVITLNKPKALNSINMKMTQAINAHLKKWEDQVSMVIIRGVGKAFCAGGDIKESVEKGPNNSQGAKEFFKLDYTNDYIIANYKHPYIAIMDGYTMGSGVGLSINGRYQVATEKTLLAMPETAIGLFPDVGASYFLPRLPGNMGMLIALTGSRLKGVDCVKVGLASHYCNSENIPGLVERLIATGGSVKAIESTLNELCPNVNNLHFSLAGKEKIVDTIFGLSSIESIFDALEKEGSDWSKEVLATMKKMSPLSLKVTHREMTLGKTLSLKECLQMEYRLCHRALEAKFSNDFYEGVRALLIDKDRNPKWNPAELNDISSSTVDQYFTQLPPGEEMTFKCDIKLNNIYY